MVQSTLRQVTLALTDEQKATIAAGARTTDVSLRWTMSQLFLVIHSALLTFLLGRYNFGTVPHIIGSGLGLWLAWVWFLAVRRAQYLIDHWIETLAELEVRGLSEHERTQALYVFQGVRAKVGGVPTYEVFRLLVCAFVFAWAALFVYSLAHWAFIAWRSIP